MTDKWKANEPVVKAIVEGCKQLEEDKRLDLELRVGEGFYVLMGGATPPRMLQRASGRLGAAGGS